ncbi:MAG: hypothetical protein JETT_0997 [Candidatus Jettenia ecosi]|uniref:Uncharacterized protein n=1 Tax=Candidatus Jettenia ecosi TaxID=2494326 RepID=A0A533QD76_9BACT|nr:MAG: hypothetical protein JETT_0997 [Candidatus Jettenia ecosi]
MKEKEFEHVIIQLPVSSGILRLRIEYKSSFSSIPPSRKPMIIMLRYYQECNFIVSITEYFLSVKGETCQINKISL